MRPIAKRCAPAARAVIAAGLQDKLWEMSDLAFDHQERRTDEDFLAFAAELELDVAQFSRDFEVWLRVECALGDSTC